MLKKILLINLLAITALFGSKIKYEDPKTFDYLNIRPFVGLEFGYSYLKNNFDRSSENIGYYVGLPYRQYEIVLKQKIDRTNDLKIETKSVTLNFPDSGSGTDLFYWGLIFGQADAIWDKGIVTKYALQDDTTTKNFYGIHIGNKYKFQRHFYVKIELEYTNYNISKETVDSDLYIDNSLEFIYGVEYRF